MNLNPSEIADAIKKAGNKNILSGVLDAIDKQDCHVVAFGEVDHFGANGIHRLVGELAPQLRYRGFSTMCMEIDSSFQSAMTQFEDNGDMDGLASVVCPQLVLENETGRRAICRTRSVNDFFGGRWYPEEDNVQGFMPSYEKMLIALQAEQFRIACIDRPGSSERDQFMAEQISFKCDKERVLWLGGSRHMASRSERTEFTNEILRKNKIQTFTIVGFELFQNYPDFIDPSSANFKLLEQVLDELSSAFFVDFEPPSPLHESEAMVSHGDKFQFGVWDAGCFFPPAER